MVLGDQLTRWFFIAKYYSFVYLNDSGYQRPFEYAGFHNAPSRGREGMSLPTREIYGQCCLHIFVLVRVVVSWHKHQFSDVVPRNLS